MIRRELTDAQWRRIERLVPGKEGDKGRHGEDNRRFVEGVLWINRTGAPWRDLPDRFGPWQTVYDHFSKWRRKGVYDRILETLQIRLDRDGQIDWDLWCIDGSSVRASRAAAGACKKVPSSTRKNPPTTPWAAREADLAVNSTWLLTVAACR